MFLTVSDGSGCAQRHADYPYGPSFPWQLGPKVGNKSGANLLPLCQCINTFVLPRHFTLFCNTS